MSEEQPTQPKDGEQGKTDITIKVDRSKEIEDLQKQLKEAEDERKKAEADLQTAQNASKALEDEKKALEEDKGDLEAKMQLIAEKEFLKKKEILITKAKELFKTPEGKEDEDKVKKLTDQLEQEDSKKAAEALKMNEFMIGHLEEMLVKGAQIEADAKKAEAEKNKQNAQANKDAGSEQGSKATGQTPLNPDDAGKSATSGSNEGDSWDSHFAMIADLRRRARDPKDPEKQAEAQAILQELWKKWATTVKKDYGQGKMDYKPEKQKSVRQLHQEGI